MNSNRKIIQVIDYIYIPDEPGYKELHRRVIYEDEGLQGETYEAGEWHNFPGALTYYPDPSPGDFVDEEQAKEIMSIIDKENQSG